MVAGGLELAKTLAIVLGEHQAGRIVALGYMSHEHLGVAYSMLASGQYAVLGENSSQSDQTGKYFS